ncbi:MAG: PhnD/SsuA/transferrin family substrate-binding protein [Rhodospirillaceae bacterium]|nr:PhnD/SsuA/transferrin family substrate-binding protein [Rhodospirillaceae bacterium]
MRIVIAMIRHSILALIFLIGLTTVGLAAPTPADETARDVSIGVLAFRGGEDAEYAWGPTLRHLSATLPQYRFRLIPLGPEKLYDAVRDRQIDFLISNPGQYVEQEAAHGIARIATVAFEGGPLPSEAIGSTVFVRKDRMDLRQWSDLKGKRLIAVSPDLFGGFRIAWREFAEHGIDPLADMASLHFSGFPVKQLFDAVARGDADVGIARGCALEELAAKGSIDPSLFTVIAGHPMTGWGCVVSSRLYPDWPLAKLAHTSNTLARDVALALLSMPPGDHGQNWTIPVDYQSVHDLFRALKIGPYSHLRQGHLTETLRDYAPWLTLIAFGLVWGFVHYVRVRFLLKRRTEELNLAHSLAWRQRERMEHAARLSLMGEMASSLAHEISQPLAAIVNYAHGCQRRLEAASSMADMTASSTADMAVSAGKILAQAERASAIVHRMRDFVRKRPPAPFILDVGEVIDKTLDFFIPLIEKKRVSVHADLPPSLPPVCADRIQLEEVLLNLLQNAVEAVDGVPYGNVRIFANTDGKNVRIGVADNGTGLSGLTTEQMFEAFHTGKPQGLGLGLSLCRSIVEAHGGRIWAEAGVNGGMVMTFTLPIAEGESV